MNYKHNIQDEIIATRSRDPLSWDVECFADTIQWELELFKNSQIIKHTIR